jgi:hypothetical protein
LDDDEFNENIFNQIDLKYIILTKKMLDTLLLILDKEKEYLNEFIIKDYNDLFNNNIFNIMIYFTLINYTN